MPLQVRMTRSDLFPMLDGRQSVSLHMRYNRWRRDTCLSLRNTFSAPLFTTPHPRPPPRMLAVTGLEGPCRASGGPGRAWEGLKGPPQGPTKAWQGSLRPTEGSKVSTRCLTRRGARAGAPTISRSASVYACRLLFNPALSASVARRRFGEGRFGLVGLDRCLATQGDCEINAASSMPYHGCG